MKKIGIFVSYILVFGLLAHEALALSVLKTADKTPEKNPCDTRVLPDDLYADFRKALGEFLKSPTLEAIDKQIADGTKTDKRVDVEVYIEDLESFKKQWKEDNDGFDKNKGKTKEEFDQEAENIYDSHPAWTYATDTSNKDGVQIIRVKFFCQNDLRLRTIDNTESGGWKLAEQILHEFMHVKVYAFDVLHVKPPFEDHDKNNANDDTEDFFKELKKYFDDYKKTLVSLAPPAASSPEAGYASLDAADLSLPSPGVLPTSRWYFLKEWKRGVQRFFAFGIVSKTELDLKVADEKAAELAAVSEKSEAKPDAIKRAIENYRESQNRLLLNFAKIKDFSANARTSRLSEALRDRSEKHIKLLSDLAEKQLDRTNYQNIVDTEEKVSDILAAATDQDPEKKERARAQIERAEMAVAEAERALAEFGEGAGSAVQKEVLKPKPTIKLSSGDEPGTLKRIAENESPTPQDRFFLHAQRLLAEAREKLARAKAAFTEERYGEAYGQAVSAEALARNAFRFLEAQGGDAPEKEFTTGESSRLGVELFFDRYNEGHRYYMQIKGIPGESFFKEVSGLEVATEVVEYQVGGKNDSAVKLPGQTRYSHIVLKRGMTKSKAFLEWLERTVGKEAERKNGAIVAFDQKGTAERRYNFFEAWLARWKAPSLDSKGDTTLIEELELAVERLEYAKSAPSITKPPVSKEPQVCIAIYKPVCGADGKTYSNECFASAAGVKISSEGTCKPEATPKCQIQCLRYDPVCGTDGKTYGCGAVEAECNGIKVAYTGECRRSDEPCICTQEYAPVCGADGKTYGNACTAKCSGVAVSYLGECKLAPTATPKPTPTPTPVATVTPTPTLEGSTSKPTPSPTPTPTSKDTLTTTPTPTPTPEPIVEFKLEADDRGFYPTNVIEVAANAKVRLTFLVRLTNVYYGGLSFRSPKFETGAVKPGDTVSVEFVADQSFAFSSYWPFSSTLKATGKVEVIRTAGTTAL